MVNWIDAALEKGKKFRPLLQLENLKTKRFFVLLDGEPFVMKSEKFGDFKAMGVKEFTGEGKPIVVKNRKGIEYQREYNLIWSDRLEYDYAPVLKQFMDDNNLSFSDIPNLLFSIQKFGTNPNDTEYLIEILKNLTEQKE